MRIKKLSVLIFFIIIAIGVSGCMQQKTDVTDYIINHMNEKYDDTFTYKNPFGGGAGKNGVQMMLSSEKYPDEEIWVKYSKEDDGVVIKDNYVSVKYKQHTVKKITDIIEEIIDDDFVLYYEIRPLVHTENSSNSMTFEEYISEPSSNVTFRAAVKSGQISDSYKEEFENNLEKKFKENNICCQIGSLFFYEDENFEKISRNFAEYGDEGNEYFAWFKFTMVSTERYETSIWR